MEKKFLDCLLRGLRDLDNAIDYFDVIADNIQAWRWIFLANAGGDMEFPSMPRAGDVFSFHGAFS